MNIHEGKGCAYKYEKCKILLNWFIFNLCEIKIVKQISISQFTPNLVAAELPMILV